MKKDIENRQDLVDLMTDFYDVALHDELLGQHFTELDLAEHIPVTADFWEKTLFGRPVYYRNAMAVHQTFDQKNKMKPEHFVRWVEIFVAAIDNRFEGENAANAKQRARMIADSLNQRLNESERAIPIGSYRRPF